MYLRLGLVWQLEGCPFSYRKKKKTLHTNVFPCTLLYFLFQDRSIALCSNISSAIYIFLVACSYFAYMKNMVGKLKLTEIAVKRKIE